MPIPGVNDYIPDTAGDLSAGLGIARQIQANKNAAFERQQQTAQLAQQKQQHQQAVIAGLMERGVEPVTAADGTLDVPASVALKKKKDLSRSNGAIAALNDLSPAPEDANDEDFLAGYVPVKQARDRQALLNEARIQAVKERNAGNLNVQDLRNEGAADRAKQKTQDDVNPEVRTIQTELGPVTFAKRGHNNWQIIPDRGLDPQGNMTAQDVLQNGKRVGIRVGGKFYKDSALDQLIQGATSPAKPAAKGTQPVAPGGDPLGLFK